MTPLERELRGLAVEVDWPATPDVAAAVQPRLEPRRAPLHRLSLRARLAVAAALLVVAVAAVPPARSAVLDVFGLAGGEQGRRVPRLPPAPAREDPSQAPGARTSLARARAVVDFPVTVPTALGAPDVVRLWTGVPGGAVVQSWGRTDALWSFRGSASHYVRKFVTPDTRVRVVRVQGVLATWLTGTPVGFVVEGRDGTVVQGSAAVVDANVLVWRRGGVAYRLETKGGLARALRIAASNPSR